MARPSFEELYREHYRLAWYAIRKSGVRRPEVIEELVHDVFIVVHRRMAELDQHEGTIRGWIYRISVYVALNYLSRSHHRREALMESTVQEETLAAPGDIEARVAAREHLRLLLESTTPERRAVYELVEIEGFTLPETAARLEIPLTTVESRLRHARSDINAAEMRLRHRAGRRLAILPIGAGAWLHLRDAAPPPADASDRVWERVQSTIRAQVSTASTSPQGPEPEPEPESEPRKQPWLRRASPQALRALGPSLGALGGAVAALVYAHATQAPPRVIAVRFPVMVVQEAELQTIPPEEPAPEEASAALVPPAGSGGEPGKVANPAALLALRKAQAAYVRGDKSGALAALGAFEGELAGDPLRSDAARLRTLVLQREEGVR